MMVKNNKITRSENTSRRPKSKAGDWRIPIEKFHCTIKAIGQNPNIGQTLDLPVLLSSTYSQRQNKTRAQNGQDSVKRF